jgi:hypothetical protein
MCECSLLDQALAAAERNSALAGVLLGRSARTLAAISVQHNLAVISADDAGERIIGAALTVNSRMRMVDRTRRVDNGGVLIVAGYMVGPYDVASLAATMRSLGAIYVHAALLESTVGNISGCDTVTLLSHPSRALRIA